MSLVIDTNILIYAINKDSPHHKLASAFIEKQRVVGFCVTWSILYEWLRIATHPKVFSHPLEPKKAQDFIMKIAGDPSVDILVETSQHSRFLQMALEEAPALRGNLYHDAHIAAIMLEHGIRKIATADGHFRLFSSLQVIDPTKS